MSRRMWVLAVTAWVAVVAAGSVLTWVAIDRAGQQVTGNPTATETQPAVVGTVGTAPTAPSTSTLTPSATASTTPAAPTTTPSPTRPSTTRTSTSTPKTSSPPPVQTVTRTWSGAAGTVTVSCTGSTARLKGASPADGWIAERGDASGGEIEVTFHSASQEVQVKATCVGGVPRFAVESGSGGDSTDSSHD